MSYCPNCGRKLIRKYIDLEGNIPFCTRCNKLFFPHSTPCMIVVIEYQEKLLLVRQNYISTIHDCFVAGHVKQGETVEDTLFHEVKEEVGLDVKEFRYVNSYYYSRSNHLMLGYYCKAVGDIKINHEVDAYTLCDVEEAKQRLGGALTASSLLSDCIQKGLGICGK